MTYPTGASQWMLDGAAFFFSKLCYLKDDPKRHDHNCPNTGMESHLPPPFNLSHDEESKFTFPDSVKQFKICPD